MKVYILKTIRDEDGAVPIVEMTLIFPFVLVVIAFLLYLGSYILQSATMYNDAQMIAVLASREETIPGYHLLYGVGGYTTKADFNWDTNSALPGKEVVDDIMKNHDPYRYWSTDSVNKIKSNLEEETVKLIQKNSFLAATNVECNIISKGGALNKSIEVNIVKKVTLPGVFQYIGVKGDADINVTAVAVSSDNCEFIRDTDLAFSVAENAWSNFKFGKNNQSMSQRVSIFTQRLQDTLKKFQR